MAFWLKGSIQELVRRLLQDYRLRLSIARFSIFAYTSLLVSTESGDHHDNLCLLLVEKGALRTQKSLVKALPRLLVSEMPARCFLGFGSRKLRELTLERTVT